MKRECIAMDSCDKHVINFISASLTSLWGGFNDKWTTVSRYFNKRFLISQKFMAFFLPLFNGKK